MTYWEHVTATAIGALLAFLFGLSLFWVKERWLTTSQKNKAIKNLLYEFEYNLNLFQEYRNELTSCMEDVSADKRDIDLNLDYSFVATYFSTRFYNEGYLSDFLHQEDMKKWNIFLSKLSSGSEKYIVEEVDKWREKGGDKKGVHDALKAERNHILIAMEMIEYLKTKIKL